MAKLKWDQVGERQYETGVDHGVLYIPNVGGEYANGYVWNGLVSVTESPSGAESTPQYADNIKYLNLVSAEEFGATVEAFTYPDEFGQCDGTAAPTDGVALGQQGRRSFGLSYRTIVGTDLNDRAGYKLHLIYGALAAPSEKGYTTINDSPEAITFSWEVTTTPVEVGEVDGVDYRPTASLVIDSRKVDAAALAFLEEMLYGTVGDDPMLPMPADVLALFMGTVTTVTPAIPAFNAATDTITIPNTAGVVYRVDGEVVGAGPLVITEDTVVTASPATGHKFPPNTDTDWGYDYTP